MDEIGVKAFALITLGTTALVGALKKAFPKWIDGKEPLLSIAIPVLGVALMKATGIFKGTEWIDALLLALGAGIGAGVSHDKIVNPLISNKPDPSEGAK